MDLRAMHLNHPNGRSPHRPRPARARWWELPVLVVLCVLGRYRTAERLAIRWARRAEGFPPA